jgi:hypothetical protein
MLIEKNKNLNDDKEKENPESRDMRMVGEGEPGFPNC